MFLIVYSERKCERKIKKFVTVSYACKRLQFSPPRSAVYREVSDPLTTELLQRVHKAVTSCVASCPQVQVLDVSDLRQLTFVHHSNPTFSDISFLFAVLFLQFFFPLQPLQALQPCFYSLIIFVWFWECAKMCQPHPFAWKSKAVTMWSKYVLTLK